MKPFTILFFIFCCLLLTTGYSQQTKKPKTQLVSYNENVKAPLSVKEMNMLEEVYKDKLNLYILSNPSRLKNMKHLLRNRLQVVEYKKPINKDKFTNLSEYELFDNYNESLSRDTMFDKSTFNPLKYNLPFFNFGDAMFKIFDTNYYLVIKSQTTKK